MKPDPKSMFLKEGGWRKMVAGSDVALLVVEIYGVAYDILSTNLRIIIPESEMVSHINKRDTGIIHVLEGLKGARR